MSTVTPILTNTSTKHVFYIYDEIYTGPTGTGQYVPKINDAVRKYNADLTYTDYKVTAVDSVTNLSTLTEVTPALTNTNYTPLNSNSESFVVYYDTRTTPYTLQIDRRLTVANNSASYARIFRGYDITDTTKIISQSYNSPGVYVNDLISLELVALDTYNSNTGIRAPMKGYTTASLLTNEPLTVVYYDSVGTVILKKLVRVEPTNMIAGLNTDTKFVTGIALKTPFTTSVNSSSISYPSNLAFNAANFTGIVYYTNGYAELPIDGTTFKIEGLDGYIPNSANQTYGLTLKYTLRSGESGYGNSTSNLFAQNYNLVTTAANTAYTVRIHAYPIWNSSTSSYSLRWYLTTFNRSTYYDITNYINVISGSFDGTKIGVTQTLNVSVNLNAVNGTYSNVIYTQSVSVNLANTGSFRQVNTVAANWFVYNTSNLSTPFGAGVFATMYYPSAGVANFNITGLYAAFSDWLNAYYTLANPIRDALGNTMTPTHVTVITDISQITIPISSFNTSLSIPSKLANNSNITLVFQNLSAGVNAYILPIVIPVYQVDVTGTYI